MRAMQVLSNFAQVFLFIHFVFPSLFAFILAKNMKVCKQYCYTFGKYTKPFRNICNRPTFVAFLGFNVFKI